MTDDALRSEVARIETALAQAEQDALEMRRMIDAQHAPALASLTAEIAETEKELAKVNARLKHLTRQTAIIRRINPTRRGMA